MHRVETVENDHGGSAGVEVEIEFAGCLLNEAAGATTAATFVFGSEARFYAAWELAIGEVVFLF